MAAADVTAVLARIKNRIESVADVGLVYDFDPYSSSDLAPLIVSRIAGVPTLRAWWITGPSMTSRPLTADPAQYLERVWTYQVHGIVGVAEDGSHLNTLRVLSVAVTDAIDADRHLAGTAHRTDPCRWVTAPENRTLLNGEVGVGYVQIHKPVITVSTP
jgi:hypothetical protein